MFQVEGELLSCQRLLVELKGQRARKGMLERGRGWNVIGCPGEVHPIRRHLFRSIDLFVGAEAVEA